jgi:hypothetical protein
VARIPPIGQNIEVPGAPAGPRASGEDFLPGFGQGQAAARTALSASSEAGAAEVRARGLLAQATSELGAGIANAGEALYKQAEASNLSTLQAEVATRQNRWTAELQARRKNGTPGDTGLVDKFLGDFDKDTEGLEKLARTRAGQNYVREATTRMRGHFFVQAAEAQSELVGMKVRSDADTVMNQLSSSVRSDPRSLPESLQQFRLAIPGFRAAGLSVDEAEKLRVQGEELLAVSAVGGEIDQDPKAAKRKLESPYWDSLINGKQKDALLGEATRAIKAREEELETKRRQQEHERNLRQKDVFNKLVDDFLLAGKLPSDPELRALGLDAEYDLRARALREQIREQNELKARTGSSRSMALAVAEGDFDKLRNLMTALEAEPSMILRAGQELEQVKKVKEEKAAQVSMLEAMAAVDLPEGDKARIKDVPDVIRLVKSDALPYTKTGPVLESIRQKKADEKADSATRQRRVSEQYLGERLISIGEGKVKSELQLVREYAAGLNPDGRSVYIEKEHFHELRSFYRQVFGTDGSSPTGPMWSTFADQVTATLAPRADPSNPLSYNVDDYARAKAYISVKMREYMTRTAAGEKPDELLTFGSPKWLGNDLQAFVSTQQVRGITGRLTLPGQARTIPPIALPPSASNPDPRRPDETMEDRIKRKMKR